MVQHGALDSCFLDKGVHGGNMAATDPAESPPKREKSPVEEEETSRLQKEPVEPGCPPKNGEERTLSRSSRSPAEEQTARVGILSAAASHSEARSGDGSDNTTSAHKTTDTLDNDGWGFHWSETEEEDTEPKMQRQGSADVCYGLLLALASGLTCSADSLRLTGPAHSHFS